MFAKAFRCSTIDSFERTIKIKSIHSLKYITSKIFTLICTNLIKVTQSNVNSRNDAKGFFS